MGTVPNSIKVELGTLVVGQEIAGRRSPARNLKRYPLPDFGGVAQLVVQHTAVATAQAHRQVGGAERGCTRHKLVCENQATLTR